MNKTTIVGIYILSAGLVLSGISLLIAGSTLISLLIIALGVGIGYYNYKNNQFNEFFEELEEDFELLGSDFDLIDTKEVQEVAERIKEYPVAPKEAFKTIKVTDINDKTIEIPVIEPFVVKDITSEPAVKATKPKRTGAAASKAKKPTEKKTPVKKKAPAKKKPAATK
jgi:uncharacterized membrane protein